MPSTNEAVALVAVETSTPEPVGPRPDPVALSAGPVALSAEPSVAGRDLATSAPSAPRQQTASPVPLELGAAAELRRAKDFTRALALYEEVLRRAASGRAAAGVAHCLRKLGRLEEATARLAELAPAFPGSPELEAELGWARVDAELSPLLARGHVHNACLLARDLLGAFTDAELRAHVLFATLRAAKARRLWAAIDELCGLVDPATLSARARGKERDAWSDRARWHAAKAVALLRTGRPEEALSFAEAAARAFPAQRRDFERWRAQALALLGRRAEAIASYTALAAGGTRDWWLLQELGLLEAEEGRHAEALSRLCSAALACGKIDMGVQLLHDLARVALAAGDRALAAASADLAVQIRQRCGWRVPAQLGELVVAAGPCDVLPERERLAQCRALWRAYHACPEPAPTATERRPQASVGSELRGQLQDPDPKRPFCFIRAAGGAHFCLRADLPPGATDGARVRFKLVPSFDRKKQQESLRATEVRLEVAGGER